MHPSTNEAQKQVAHKIIAAFFPQLTISLTEAFLHERCTAYIINLEGKKRVGKFKGD